MEDEKKRYTFTDKRGREDEPKHDPRAGEPRSGGTESGTSERPAQEAAVDFSTLIMSFASAAMISMGKIPDPATGQIGRNLAIAHQNIGIISLLKEKTKGNLSSEEQTLLETILYELKIAYIEAQKG